MLKKKKEKKKSLNLKPNELFGQPNTTGLQLAILIIVLICSLFPNCLWFVSLLHYDLVSVTTYVTYALFCCLLQYSMCNQASNKIDG